MSFSPPTAQLNLFQLNGNYDPCIGISTPTGHSSSIRLRGLAGGSGYSLALTERAVEWCQVPEPGDDPQQPELALFTAPKPPRTKPVIICCDDGFEFEDSVFHYLKFRLNSHALSIQGMTLNADAASQATPQVLLWRQKHGAFFTAARAFYLQAKQEQNVAQRHFTYLATRWRAYQKARI